jgi:hypothetical protein
MGHGGVGAHGGQERPQSPKITRIADWKKSRKMRGGTVACEGPMNGAGLSFEQLSTPENVRKIEKALGKRLEEATGYLENRRFRMAIDRVEYEDTLANIANRIGDRVKGSKGTLRAGLKYLMLIRDGKNLEEAARGARKIRLEDQLITSGSVFALQQAVGKPLESCTDFGRETHPFSVELDGVVFSGNLKALTRRIGFVLTGERANAHAAGREYLILMREGKTPKKAKHLVLNTKRKLAADMFDSSAVKRLERAMGGKKKIDQVPIRLENNPFRLEIKGREYIDTPYNLATRISRELTGKPHNLKVACDYLAAIRESIDPENARLYAMNTEKRLTVEILGQKEARALARALKNTYGRGLDEMSCNRDAWPFTLKLGDCEYNDSLKNLAGRIGYGLTGKPSRHAAGLEYLVHICDGMNPKEAKEAVLGRGKRTGGWLAAKGRKFLTLDMFDRKTVLALEKAIGKPLDGLNCAKHTGEFTLRVGKREYADTLEHLTARIGYRLTKKYSQHATGRDYLINIRDGMSPTEALERLKIGKRLSAGMIDANVVERMEAAMGKKLDGISLHCQKEPFTVEISGRKYTDTPYNLGKRISRTLGMPGQLDLARDFLVSCRARSGAAPNPALNTKMHVPDSTKKPRAKLTAGMMNSRVVHEIEDQMGTLFQGTPLYKTRKPFTVELSGWTYTDTPRDLCRRICRELGKPGRPDAARDFLVACREHPFAVDAPDPAKSVKEHVPRTGSGRWRGKMLAPGMIDGDVVRQIENGIGMRLEDAPLRTTTVPFIVETGDIAYTDNLPNLCRRICRMLKRPEQMDFGRDFLISCRDRAAIADVGAHALGIEKRRILEAALHGKELTVGTIDRDAVLQMEKAIGMKIEDAPLRTYSKPIIVETRGRAYTDTLVNLSRRICRKLGEPTRINAARKYLIACRDNAVIADAPAMNNEKTQINDGAENSGKRLAASMFDVKTVRALETALGSGLEALNCQRKKWPFALNVGGEEYSDSMSGLTLRIGTHMGIGGISRHRLGLEYLACIRDGKSQLEARDIVLRRKIGNRRLMTALMFGQAEVIGLEKKIGKRLDGLDCSRENAPFGAKIGNMDYFDSLDGIAGRIGYILTGLAKDHEIGRDYLIGIRNGMGAKEAVEHALHSGKRLNAHMFGKKEALALEENIGTPLEELDGRQENMRFRLKIGDKWHTDSLKGLFERIGFALSGTADWKIGQLYLIHVRNGKTPQQAMGMALGGENLLSADMLERETVQELEWKVCGKRLSGLNCKRKEWPFTLNMGGIEYNDTLRGLSRRIGRMMPTRHSSYRAGLDYLARIGEGKSPIEARDLVLRRDGRLTAAMFDQNAVLGMEEALGWKLDWRGRGGKSHFWMKIGEQWHSDKLGEVAGRIGFIITGKKADRKIGMDYLLQIRDGKTQQQAIGFALRRKNILNADMVDRNTVLELEKAIGRRLEGGRWDFEVGKITLNSGGQEYTDTPLNLMTRLSKQVLGRHAGYGYGRSYLLLIKNGLSRENARKTVLEMYEDARRGKSRGKPEKEETRNADKLRIRADMINVKIVKQLEGRLNMPIDGINCNLAIMPITLNFGNLECTTSMRKLAYQLGREILGNDGTPAAGRDYMVNIKKGMSQGLAKRMLKRKARKTLLHSGMLDQNAVRDLENALGTTLEGVPCTEKRQFTLKIQDKEYRDSIRKLTGRLSREITGRENENLPGLYYLMEIRSGKSHKNACRAVRNMPRKERLNASMFDREAVGRLESAIGMKISLLPANICSSPQFTLKHGDKYYHDSLINLTTRIGIEFTGWNHQYGVGYAYLHHIGDGKKPEEARELALSMSTKAPRLRRKSFKRIPGI